MLTGLRRAAILMAMLAPGLVLQGGIARAGPQDDPPPVEVTPGAPLLSGDDTTVTLTLDSAGHAGDLEAGAIQAAAAAAAAITSGGTGGADTGSAGLEDSSDGSSGGIGGGALASSECAWRDASNLPAASAAWGGNDPTAGTLLVNTCNGPALYLFVPNTAPGAVAAAAVVPPPPPDPAVLAQRAYGELTLPKPVAKRSPDEGNSDPAYGGLPYTYTNLWTWTWAGEWQPVARTVELLGVSATVTATPTQLIFDPGDGTAPEACDGPGRPWTPADENVAPAASGGCGHMYRAVTPAGPLTATTTIQWDVVWTSNVGAGGTFPVLTTQDTSSFLVEQIQVVNR